VDSLSERTGRIDPAIETLSSRTWSIGVLWSGSAVDGGRSTAAPAGPCSIAASLPDLSNRLAVGVPEALSRKLPARPRACAACLWFGFPGCPTEVSATDFREAIFAERNVLI
jgi:hypothetical protein